MEKIKDLEGAGEAARKALDDALLQQKRYIDQLDSLLMNESLTSEERKELLKEVNPAKDLINQNINQLKSLMNGLNQNNG
jgi:hypothetical protein